jgi:streptogramin lyase
MISSGIIANSAPWSFTQSRDGTIWIPSAGIGRVVNKSESVTNYFPFLNMPNYLRTYSGYVQAFTEDDSGNIWMGSNVQGLLRYDPSSDSLTHYQAPDYLSANTIQTLAADRRGMIWIGYGEHSSGLDRFDPTTGTFYHFEHLPGRPGSLPHPAVTAILVDSLERFWVGTNGGGVCLFEEQTETFLPNPFNSDQTGKQITALNEDHAGGIWIAGIEESQTSRPSTYLDYLHPTGNEVVRFLTQPRSSIGQITSIAQTDRQTVWLGTSKGGLLRLDRTSGNWQQYNDKNSRLPENRIQALMVESKNRLWFITPSHLVKADLESETFFVYGAAHGLHPPFTRKGGWKSRRGEFFFGGYNIVHHFIPGQLKENKLSTGPQTRITGLFIDEERQVGVSSSSQDSSTPFVLTLGPKVEQFAVQFSCFDYQNLNATQYEFRLDPYEDHWQKAKGKPEAVYQRIPPGKYTFRVRSANAQGLWDTVGTSLQVVVTPPWWQTWWAYTLYAVAFFGIVFTIYRFQFNRRLAFAEARRLRELDELKTRLYTNITHEFRTPLTVILGMADKVSEDPQKWFRNGIDMIRRNGHNLLRLINHMLDLSKLESGVLPVNMVQGDVVNYLEYLIDSFYSYAGSKDIRLHFLCPHEELYMDYDAEKLLTIVSNLLSNAVKFTPEGGDVYVQLAVASGQLPVGSWQATNCPLPTRACQLRTAYC